MKYLILRSLLGSSMGNSIIGTNWMFLLMSNYAQRRFVKLNGKLGWRKSCITLIDVIHRGESALDHAAFPKQPHAL